MKIVVEAEINNLSAEDIAPYIVARLNTETNELWYWGSYDNKEKADQAASEIGGLVVKMYSI